MLGRLFGQNVFHIPPESFSPRPMWTTLQCSYMYIADIRNEFTTYKSKHAVAPGRHSLKLSSMNLLSEKFYAIDLF